MTPASHDDHHSRHPVRREQQPLVYDASISITREGGGLDGRDGPELSSLSRLSDAAMNHLTEVAKAGFAQERSTTTPLAIPT